MIDLRFGDCLAVMATIESASVPLIVADPPYGIGYHSNHYVDKNPHAPVANDWNFQPGAFFRECERLLIDGGAMYLFCRWDVTPLWLPYLNGSGLRVKTVIAWVKDNWSAGDLEGCFGNQWEQILFVTKGRHRLRGRRWPNVWKFARVSHTKMLHPTQKPVPLLERAIRASSDEGDLVLDPFTGSGSTGKACQHTGRDAFLIDVDPRMIALTRRRLRIKTPIDLPAVESEPILTPGGLELPDPSEWGVHPEDLAYIRDALRGNLESEGMEETPLFSGATS
jgi:site-specific DNA-methyltransferase (adenine-specific)